MRKILLFLGASLVINGAFVTVSHSCQDLAKSDTTEQKIRQKMSKCGGAFGIVEKNIGKMNNLPDSVKKQAEQIKAQFTANINSSQNMKDPKQLGSFYQKNLRPLHAQLMQLQHAPAGASPKRPPAGVPSKK